MNEHIFYEKCFMRRSITLSGITCRVYFVDEVSDGQKGMHGLFNSYRLKVFLSCDADPQQLELTLLHELVHMLMHVRGLSQDETFIQNIASALYELGVGKLLAKKMKINYRELARIAHDYAEARHA